LRVVFAGTPPFAAAALEAILAAGHDVALVLSQPDRPAGRGLKLAASAVARLAAGRGLALHKPATLKSAEAQAPIRDAAPDVMVVAAYGLLLPPAVLAIPALGCLNIHASLLPRWRGAAPIQRALLAGDAETGVDIMRMEAGLDTGPVLLEKRISIGARETAGTLTDKLARLGAEAVVEALASLNSLSLRAQDSALATYASKVSKVEAQIDWSRAAAEIDRQVRAFNPAPGAETTLGGQALKIWEALPGEGSGAPGTVLEGAGGALRVACGGGALAITSLQRAGSRRLDAQEFLRGFPIPAGTVLGGPAAPV
jgi:methionyl-tRNA formyltransferase